MELFHRDETDMPDEKLIDCGASPSFFQEQDSHAGGSGRGRPSPAAWSAAAGRSDCSDERAHDAR